MMSAKRLPGSLEGNAAVLVYGGLHRSRRFGLWYDIDAHTEKFPEAMPDEIEATESGKAAAEHFEAHGHVDVGLVGGLVACRRSEQRDACNAKLAELGRMGFQGGKSVCASHPANIPHGMQAGDPWA